MNFENYKDTNLEGCLKLFDINCPQFFAEVERQDYVDYLKSTTDIYKIGYSKDAVVAAFGMGIDRTLRRARVTWIMVCPLSSGQGIGRQMMTHVIALAREKDVAAIDIAASHLSAPFFEKFAATTVKVTDEGWGPEMHRVDMEIKL